MQVGTSSIRPRRPRPWRALRATRHGCTPLREAGYLPRRTFSQPFTLSRLSTTATSFLPTPQLTVSFLPLRAFTVSLPAPPSYFFTPGPPVSLSLPPPPNSLSLPASPNSLSLPPAP